MIRVLYIEDNEDNIFLFTRRLGKHGFEVLIARDGAVGLEMAGTTDPSIILMDLDLPIIDGWEATRRLKAAAATRDIPVIAVSSYAMPEDRRRAIETGCSDFFSKPVDMKALCGRIEVLAEHGRQPGSGEGH
ncbi:response regulator [Leisingera sp. NJS204]|uniref:response regulator n=1 Tax=Leisingera sp. NJS204 TaxID=2508307 RepID=UPI0010107415|nr:response regulator [Leisingera sp. NJS204]QAX28393.1 response regulator [Leisingera sp. NJS204]